MKLNLPEYALEAVELCLFMLSACTFAILLQHPASPLTQQQTFPLLPRVLMGVAMGGTAASIIYSPIGVRSGAHFNPAVTFTYWRLGRVKTPDAFFYVIAQFFGGSLGIALAAAVFGGLISHPAINFAATNPGPGGWRPAFAGEVTISFFLMLTVLTTSEISWFKRYTGLLASGLVAIFIAIESPLSGMSMNPARSFASAIGAGSWGSIWIYFVAPPIGMLAASEVFLRLPRIQRSACAKLYHSEHHPCIFCQKN